MRLCIIIQYWSGDYAAAMRLARYVEHLGLPSGVELMFARRWDAPEPELNRRTIVSPIGRTGWPEGCNLVALAAMRWADENLECPFFLMEPDCIPVTRTWIERLLIEWSDEFWLMGTWSPEGGPKEGHVNGNCMMRPDFFRLAKPDIPQGLAWDVAIGPSVADHWKITKLIKNCFREPHITPDQIERGSPVLIHGIQSDDVWDYVRGKGLTAQQ